MKIENPNIEIIQTAIAEANRFIQKSEIAKMRLIENDKSGYRQYTFKEVGAIKRAALDLKDLLTTITKMVS